MMVIAVKEIKGKSKLHGSLQDPLILRVHKRRCHDGRKSRHRGATSLDAQNNYDKTIFGGADSRDPHGHERKHRNDRCSSFSDEVSDSDGRGKRRSLMDDC